MSFRLSNNLMGILNGLTILVSLAMLMLGIRLKFQRSSECEQLLDTGMVELGAVLLFVSIAGLIGACFRVTWLMCLYLAVMFLLIAILFCFTILTFGVTNKGADEALSNRGYKEYRLGDYSQWLQKRVDSYENWRGIKNCLQSSKFCQAFATLYAHDTAQEFYQEKLSTLWSGCCKPSNDCGFAYVNPTNWTKSIMYQYPNTDCYAWNNDPNILCFDCQACKAGIVDTIKHDWKKVAIVNIILLVFLIGCCAFLNNVEDFYNI